MRKVALGFMLALGFAGTAWATSDSFVWEDVESGYSFSFPDSWEIQTKDAPTTRVRIAGPINADFATCRIKAEKDGRLQIYPKHLMEEAVYETLGRDFWEREVQDHDNPHITDLRGPTSMGTKGDATAIKETFVQDTGHGRINMYGEQIASIYGDVRYVASCSAKLEEFNKYAPVFGTILASIDFDSRYAPFAEGYYRDFLADPKLTLPRTKPGTIEPHASFSIRQIREDYPNMPGQDQDNGTNN